MRGKGQSSQRNFQGFCDVALAFASLSLPSLQVATSTSDGPAPLWMETSLRCHPLSEASSDAWCKANSTATCHPMASLPSGFYLTLGYAAHLRKLPVERKFQECRVVWFLTNADSLVPRVLWSRCSCICWVFTVKFRVRTYLSSSVVSANYENVGNSWWFALSVVWLLIVILSVWSGIELDVWSTNIFEDSSSGLHQ